MKMQEEIIEDDERSAVPLVGWSELGPVDQGVVGNMERLLDADFFNRFDDDFDESDMKL